MQFESPLVPGLLQRRYKRFLADVLLPGGELVTAHCANPGSMKTCMVEGGKVWLSKSDNPKRKLKYTWELSEVEGELVCVNTARANGLVEEAILAGKIEELTVPPLLRREVRYGEHTRFDFRLEGNDASAFVEVKSVTMLDRDQVAAFPDSVTKRGTKHLQELREVSRNGERAVLLFCVNRTGIASMRPAAAIDPVYAEALLAAAREGVEVLAYASDISPLGMQIAGPLPVELQL